MVLDGSSTGLAVERGRRDLEGTAVAGPSKDAGVVVVGEGVMEFDGLTGDAGEDIADSPVMAKCDNSPVRNRKLVWKGRDARIEGQKRDVEYALHAPQGETRRLETGGTGGSRMTILPALSSAKYSSRGISNDEPTS